MKATIPIPTLVDLAAGRLAPMEALHLLDQLDRDASASELLDCAIDLTAASHEEGNLFCADQPPRGSRVAFVLSAIALYLRLWERTLWRLAIAMAAIGMLSIMLVLSIYPPADSMAEEALVTDEEVLFLVRGSSGNEIDVSTILLSDHRDEDAAKLLEWFIRAFPTSKDVPRAHYLAGISWLRIGQRTILNLYPSIDGRAVRRSIPHFDAAVRLDPVSWSAMEADWYGARAYLMIGETQQAISNLTRIVKSGNIHSRNAERFLVLLDRTSNTNRGPE